MHNALQLQNRREDEVERSEIRGTDSRLERGTSRRICWVSANDGGRQERDLIKKHSHPDLFLCASTASPSPTLHLVLCAIQSRALISNLTSLASTVIGAAHSARH